MSESALIKEQKILGVCYDCNRQIAKLFETSNLKPTYNPNKYKYLFVSLMESCEVTMYNMEPQITPVIMNESGNYYAYLRKVVEFFENYEPKVITNLNESADYGDINLFAFKEDVKRVLLELEFQDETNISQNIVGIKTFLGRPIYVHGVNLVNNTQLNEYLRSKCNINPQDLLGVAYNKSEKIIHFVYDSGFRLDYSVVDDTYKKTTGEYEPRNWFEKLKADELVNNMIELYVNHTKLDLKYSDNLYYDVALTQRIQDSLRKTVAK